MRILLSLFVASLLSNLSAGENLSVFTDSAEKLKIEKQAKEKTALAKLVTGLTVEEKNAKSAGNLDLVLALRGRLAELQADGVSNPLGDVKKTAPAASERIPNSPSEKAHVEALAAIEKDHQTKWKALLAQLDAKKVSLTKAGKIDDALAVDEFIGKLKDENSGVSPSAVATPAPTTPPVSTAPVKAPADAKTAASYAGVWVKEDTGSEFILGADFSLSVPKAQDKRYLSGTWSLKNDAIVFTYPDETIELKILNADKLSGKWRLKKKAPTK